MLASCHAAGKMRPPAVAAVSSLPSSVPRDPLRCESTAFLGPSLVQSRDSDTVFAGSVPDPNMGVLSFCRRDASRRYFCVSGGIRCDVRRRRPHVRRRCACVVPNWVCRDSASYSGEGACREVSIVIVFLGCVRAEACHYAGNWGESTEGWWGVRVRVRVACTKAA